MFLGIIEAASHIMLLFLFFTSFGRVDGYYLVRNKIHKFAVEDLILAMLLLNLIK